MTSSFLLSENGTSSVERLERSYLECEDIARAASSSFFRSFRHLPEPKRRAVNALYAFCRRVDDIVDGDWLPEHNLTHLDEATTLRMEQLLSERKVNPIFSEKEHKDRLRALMFFREQLAAIQDGQPMTDPVFIALSDTLRRYPIDVEHLGELINGMEDDLFETTYARFEDLRRYCYRVASTVGLCLIEIYGYSDANARRHAVEMGLFLQLVNVLRDIQEDLGRNRIYLPTEELAKFGLTHADLNDPTLASRPAWQNFMRHYIDHVIANRNNALGLLPLLDKDARRSPRLMCMAYNAILKEAVRRNGDVLSRRLTLNFYRKMQVAFATLLYPGLD
ncbi:MAG: phytoene/squalene synthase family protein [Candidatus Poseidoniaceae archaeon]|tara:strand:- start:5278 stop:6282 length:1005 start_codon:yes stop_codon:yes gene_type:complete